MAVGTLLPSLPLAAASPQLNLLPTTPVVNGTFGNVVYDATTDTFRYEGYTAQVTAFAGAPIPLTGSGQYVLQAKVDDSGELTSGFLKIFGNLGSGFELILSGALETGDAGTVFGHQLPAAGQGVDLFEFLFTIDGGAAGVISEFGGIGAPGGVIIDANFKSGDALFNGNWTTSFSASNFNGVADAFVVVPEPSTWALMGVAVMVLLARPSRRLLSLRTRLESR